MTGPKEEQLELIPKDLKPGEIIRWVKVSIPKLVQDNPMVHWTSADNKWSQSTPIDTNIVRFMKGKLDAYFEIKMTKAEILSMKPISETEFLAHSYVN